MKNNFLQRAITGILFVAIIVGCILYDPLAFGTLFVIVSALTIREFGHLVNQSGEVSINRTITMLGGAYLFLAIMGFCIDAAGSKIFIPYLILIIYLMVSELYLKKKNPVLNWAYSMLSQMYIALPFAMLNVLAFQNDPEASSVSYNPILPLSIFVFLWLNDTGAYCFGSLFGKHRLFERISPKTQPGPKVQHLLVSWKSPYVMERKWYDRISNLYYIILKVPKEDEPAVPFPFQGPQGVRIRKELLLQSVKL